MRIVLFLVMLGLVSCNKKSDDQGPVAIEELSEETLAEAAGGSATDSDTLSAGPGTDSDGDGVLDADDVCPNDADANRQTVYVDADGDGKGDASQEALLCPSDISSAGETYVSNSEDTNDGDASQYSGANCGAVLNGAQDSRERFKLAQAPIAGACESQVQNRLCTDGVFSAWDGDSATYPEDACNQNPDNPLTVTVSLGSGASNPLVAGDQVDCAYTAASANDGDGDEISPICTWSNISGTASNCSYTVLSGDASASLSCQLRLVDGKGGSSETIASSNSISVQRATCNFAGDDYDGSSANGQDGTPANPYYLCTKAHLEDFLDKCTDVDTSCAHSVSLETDVNFGLTQMFANKLAGKTTAYTGEFNGNGYTVQGIKRTDLGTANLGSLFGTIGSGGVVKDLHINNVTILGAAKVGGLAASCDSCTIQEVYLEGLMLSNLVSSSYTGGLLSDASTSDNTSPFSISDVYVSGTLSSDGRSGGLIGQASQSISAANSQMITYAYVATTIQSSDLATGGIMGESTFVVSGETLFAGNMDASDTGNSSYGGLVGLSNNAEAAGCAAASSFYSTELSTITGGGGDGLNDTSGSQASNANLITAMAGFNTDHWKADGGMVNGGISYLKLFEDRFE